jgi:hypothetical protein
MTCHLALTTASQLNLRRWVCAVWLGIMVVISSFMLCVVCCIMAVAQGGSDAADGKGYEKVQGNNKTDPTDPANRYV